MINRTQLTERERNLRSKIHLLIQNQGFLKASLINIQTKCGKPGCKCATSEKHCSTVVEQHKDGKTRMRTVPKSKQQQIEQWVKSWRELQGLLDELSEIHWRKLEQMKKK
jgi:hypothetical protein